MDSLLKTDIPDDSISIVDISYYRDSTVIAVALESPLYAVEGLQIVIPNAIANECETPEEFTRTIQLVIVRALLESELEAKKEGYTH